VPGTLALLAAFVWSAGRRAERHDTLLGGPRVLAACGAAIACEAVLYLRLPHDEGYLIPAVPFVLVLLARVAPRRTRRLCLAALVASPFVLGVDAEPPKKGVAPATHSAWVLRQGAGGRAAVLDVLRGPLLLDHGKRVRAAQVCSAALEGRARLAPRHYVVAGVLSAELVARGGLDRAHPWLTDVASEAELRDSVAAGVQVMLLPGARERHLMLMGFDPLTTGARAFPRIE
jgi:hypothetical protein